MGTYERRQKKSEGSNMDFYRERIINLVSELEDKEKLEIIYRFIRRYLS